MPKIWDFQQESCTEILFFYYPRNIETPHNLHCMALHWLLTQFQYMRFDNPERRPGIFTFLLLLFYFLSYYNQRLPDTCFHFLSHFRVVCEELFYRITALANLAVAIAEP